LFDTVKVVRRILLLIAALTGCGVSQELYDQRTNELDRAKSELARTQGELTAARARYDEEMGQRERASALESEYLKLKKDLNATETQLEELREAHRRAEARAEVYRNLEQRLKAMIDARTLAVEFRKGKMVVKLSDQVLFDAGKAELRAEGQAALRGVAAALKEIPDRDFLVAGHTDNQPIRSSPFKSNWDLSTARAVTVVRFLQQEGVDPSHLAAAGYSEFDPRVEVPTTNEERAQNRRIEIVVMPKLEELPSSPLEESAPPTVTGPAPASPAAAPPAPPTPPPQ
jgi:chemotaxis protein MotB